MVEGALFSSGPRPEPVLPGFRHINRFWNPVQSRFIAKVMPGQYYVTRNKNEAVNTTLGSCVAVCIRDTETGIGGMNHFLLPRDPSESLTQGKLRKESARYGQYAMELLLKDLYYYGASPQNLEIKVTGGASVISSEGDVGNQNISFIKTFLADEGLSAEVMDLGGRQPRKVMYFPDSGKLMIKKLNASS